MLSGPSTKISRVHKFNKEFSASKSIHKKMNLWLNILEWQPVCIVKLNLSILVRYVYKYLSFSYLATYTNETGIVHF